MCLDEGCDDGVMLRRSLLASQGRNESQWMGFNPPPAIRIFHPPHPCSQLMEDPLSLSKRRPPAPREWCLGHLEEDSGVIDGNCIAWNVAAFFFFQPPSMLTYMKRWQPPHKVFGAQRLNYADDML